MKSNRLISLAILALLAGLLSACTGQAAVTNWPGLTSDGEFAYLADGAQVYTIRLSDHAELLNAESKAIRYPLERDAQLAFYAPPALLPDGKSIIIGNANPAKPHSLFAADPKTGTTLWSYEDAGSFWVGAPLVTADTIYIPNNDGSLYALNLTGTLRWKKINAEHGLWAHPVTNGTAIFVTSLNHFIYSIDAISGETIWKKDLQNALVSAPVVAEDGFVYTGTLSGDLFALNVDTGKIAWKTTLKGGIWSAPVLSKDGTLYLGTVDGNTGTFYAINAQTGAILRENLEESSIIASPLILTDRVLYVTEGGLIRAMTETGITNWATPIKGKLYTAPLLVGESILIAPMEGDFYLAAYDLNGVQQWTFSPK